MQSSLEPMFHWLLSLGFSERTTTDMAQRLAEPHRFYHGPFHISYLWSLFLQRQPGLEAEEQIVIGCAIAFHDIIYSIGKQPSVLGANGVAVTPATNEEASEIYFRAAIAHDKPTPLTDALVAQISEAGSTTVGRPQCAEIPHEW